MTERSCGKCEWFDLRFGDCGLCRVNPPRIVHDYGESLEGFWPVVAADDYCGKFWERVQIDDSEGSDDGA